MSKELAPAEKARLDEAAQLIIDALKGPLPDAKVTQGEGADSNVTYIEFPEETETD